MLKWSPSHRKRTTSSSSFSVVDGARLRPPTDHYADAALLGSLRGVPRTLNNRPDPRNQAVNMVGRRRSNSAKGPVSHDCQSNP